MTYRESQPERSLRAWVGGSALLLLIIYWVGAFGWATWLAVPSGVLLSFYAPGSLTLLLLRRWIRVRSRTEYVALSAVFSLGSLALAALILNYTPFGLTHRSVGLAISAWVIFLVLVIVGGAVNDASRWELDSFKLGYVVAWAVAIGMPTALPLEERLASFVAHHALAAPSRGYVALSAGCIRRASGATYQITLSLQAYYGYEGSGAISVYRDGGDLLARVPVSLKGINGRTGVSVDLGIGWHRVAGAAKLVAPGATHSLTVTVSIWSTACGR